MYLLQKSDNWALSMVPFKFLCFDADEGKFNIIFFKNSKCYMRRI